MSDEPDDEIDDWSFVDGRITETVATTRSEDGEPNAAPMGLVKDEKDETAYARLWQGSQTLENIRSTHEVTVNFVRDPVVYVRGALSEVDEDRITDARLNDADAYVRCDATHVGEERDGEVERWRLDAVGGAVENRRITTVNRGFNSVIEATVHATRLEFKPELRELFEHHVEVAEKCGGKREREAAELLRELVKSEEGGK
ncbi:MAG: DUF447 family protein [Halobacteria archaeon]|nr:DUF447 family protein [Halobacteria archaeon]